MEPKGRIIVALDTGKVEEATQWTEALTGQVGMYKIGLELLFTMLVELMLTRGAVPRSQKLAAVQKLYRQVRGRLFLDGKFMDIPNTVAGAVRAIARLELALANVHCLGGLDMLQAAAGVAGRPKLLGVTVLTSLNYTGLQRLGLMPEDILHEPERATVETRRVEQLVARYARLAQQAGLDGVVASPREIRVVREACGEGFLVVTPGVRPEWAAAGDQRRVMTPGEAVAAGADYLVVGRPITKPPAEVGTPVEAAKRIAEEIAATRAA